jgi:hypothetical protein
MRVVLALLLVISINASIAAESATAEPMPNSVETSLKEILERPEFHARKVKRSPLEEMWLRLVSDVKQKLKSFFDSLKLKQSDIADDSYFASFLSWLAEKAESVLSVLQYVGKFVFYLLLGYLGFRIFKTLRVNWPQWSLSRSNMVARGPLTHRDTKVSQKSIEELLRQGELLQAFLSVRRNIRNELLKKHSLHYSLTDWELRDKVGPSVGLFARVADLFEASVFAGKTISSDELQGVCDSYLDLQGVSE